MFTTVFRTTRCRFIRDQEPTWHSLDAFRRRSVRIAPLQSRELPDMPLKIAAKVDRADQEYFEKQIKPLLDDPNIDFIGEIGDEHKADFLGNALACLAPIDWPEPFGLNMIEAMACGTPTIAFRHGSVPEIIDDEVSGIIVENVEQAVEAVERAKSMSRAACRNVFEQRFTARRMAHDYLKLYEHMIEQTVAIRKKGYGRLTWIEEEPGDGGCRVILEDVVQIENQFYVLATSSLADDRTRVLKYGETFAVFNRLGDIESIGLGEQGLYHKGTRHLSRLALRMGEKVPQLLRSTIQDDNAFLTLDMMNTDVYHEGSLSLPRGSVHLFRSKFLWQDVCYDKLRLANFSMHPVETSVSFDFAADYADIFQVRGSKRERTGEVRPRCGRR